MAPKPSPSGAFSRGVDASSGLLTQPKGSIPRASNLLLTKRGSLRVCDGSAILAAFNGVPTLGRGEILAAFFYSPIGVPGYYLLATQALDAPIGPPQHLVSSDGGAGGSLPISTTLYYKVTACDGVGGESTASNEISYVQAGTAHKVTLTWNVVPNAAYYNIYRSTASGTEVLVVSPSVVFQPTVGTITVTVTDDGTLATPSVSISSSTSSLVLANTQYVYNTTAVHDLIPGCRVTVSGVTPSGYNLTGLVLAVPSALSFVIQVAGSVLLAPGTGGTVAGAVPSPTDTTQQTALIKVPVLILGSIITYSDANIVAFYPANPAAAFQLGITPGGGAGGGGSGGGGVGLLTVVPNTATIQQGDNVQLAAFLGTTVVTPACVWTSGNHSVATVNGAGKVTGVNFGHVGITATYAGQQAVGTVFVTS